MKRSDEEGMALKVALITSNPEHWMPIFYPTTQEITDISEYMDDEGIPDLSGYTVKYANPPTPEEARDILLSMLGDSTGTLTAEDTVRNDG